MSENAGTEEKKRVTLRDVAERAGVSVQAVSHVLTNNPSSRIPEPTRERIREAAREIGYEPNRVAQAMKSGRTHVIAAWMPIERVSVAYLQVLQALGRRAKESPYELMVMGLDDSVAYGNEPNVPGMWPVDGVIALNADMAAAKYRQAHPASNLPINIIGDTKIESGDTLSWNLEGAVKDLVLDMAASGRRRVWHVTHSWAAHQRTQDPRIRGFLEGCREAGLDGKLVEIESEDMDAAIAGLTHAQGEFGTPDAITCFGDQFATAAAWWLHESGVQVAEACEVWGYGNSPNLDFLPFSVGSLKVPFREGAELAWDWLLERIEHPGLPSRHKTFPLERVVHRARV